MPTEPDKNVEEQLKSWAKKRRDNTGGPFELHLAVRKLFQDEVSRTFPESTENVQRTGGWLTLQWPRFAFALSVTTVMIVVGVVLLPSLSKTKSGNEPVLASTDRRKPVDQAAKSLQTSGRRDAGDIAESTPSSSRTDHFNDLANADDARGKNGSVTPELAQKRSDREPARLTSAGKLKESGLAKDESRTARREAAAQNEVKPESAEEQFGLKPANAGGFDVAGAGSRSRANPPGTPASTQPRTALTDSRQLSDRNFAEGGVVAPRQSDQPLPAGAASPVEARLAPPAVDKTVALNYQKTQLARQLASSVPAAEADRLQAKNTDASFSPTSGQGVQRFAQVVKYRRNFNSPPTPGVLTSFQIEQNGQQVRIVDADGSTYSGSVEQPSASDSGAPLAAVDGDVEQSKKSASLPRVEGEAPSLRANAPDTVLKDFAFRVTGTNRLLNQLVVFEGHYLADTNAANLGANNSGSELLAPLAQLPATTSEANLSQSQLQPSAVRIRGHVTIGGNDRVEINAVPASP